MEPPRLDLAPKQQLGQASAVVTLEDIATLDNVGGIIDYVNAKRDRLIKADSDGKTLLMWLVIYGAKRCVNAILEQFSIEINKVDTTGSNCLHYASTNPENVELALLLLKYRANPLAKNFAGWSALHHAVHICSDKLITAMENSPYVKEAEVLEFQELFKEGTFTPLHLAALGPLPILQQMTSFAKKHILVKDERGMTLLHHIVQGEDPAGKLSFLNIDYNSLVNVTDRLGRTPLTLASQMGLWGIANMLLSKGADPNQGFPVPLWHAYLNKAAVADGQNAKLHFTKLLEAKASTDLVIGGYTLLDLAQALDDQEMVTLLLKYSAKRTAAFEAMKKSEEKRNAHSFIKFFQTLSVGTFTAEQLKEKKHLEVKSKRDGNRHIHDLMTQEVNIEQLSKYTDKDGWEVKNHNEETPFLFCCKFGSVENAVWLVQCGVVNTQATDKHKNNALHLSLSNNNLLVFYCLVKRFGHLVHGVNSDGLTPLHIAAQKGLYTAVDLLIKYGADTSRLAPRENSVVHLLIDSCNAENSERQVLPLLDRLSHVKGLFNFVNSDKLTALHYAWLKTRSVVFKRLTELGADTDTRTPQQKTLLMLAAEAGKLPECRTLVVAGADRNAYGTSTPLLSAIASGSLNVVELLFDRQVATGRKKVSIADPNKRVKGITPLMESIRHLFNKIAHNEQLRKDYTGLEEYQITLRLIREGADLNKSIKFLKDKRVTPLLFCAENDLHVLAKILLEHGAKVDKTPKGSHSPLYEAAKKGFVYTVDVFVTHGAKIEKEWQNKTTIPAAIREQLRFAIQRRGQETASAGISRTLSLDVFKKRAKANTVKSANQSDDDMTSTSSSVGSSSNLASVQATPRGSGKNLLSPRELSEKLDKLRMDANGASIVGSKT